MSTREEIIWSRDRGARDAHIVVAWHDGIGDNRGAELGVRVQAAESAMESEAGEAWRPRGVRMRMAETRDGRAGWGGWSGSLPDRVVGPKSQSLK